MKDFYIKEIKTGEHEHYVIKPEEKVYYKETKKYRGIAKD